MNEDDEKRNAAQLVKAMAVICVRNTHLETIHAGRVPATRIGDWGDVTVAAADANRIIDDDCVT